VTVVQLDRSGGLVSVFALLVKSFCLHAEEHHSLVVFVIRLAALEALPLFKFRSSNWSSVSSSVFFFFFFEMSTGTDPAITDPTKTSDAGGNGSNLGAKIASQPADPIQAGASVLSSIVEQAIVKHKEVLAPKRPRVDIEVDDSAFEQAEELRLDFQNNEQKTPRDPIGHRVQNFTGFQLGCQVVSLYIKAGRPDKALEWLNKLQFRAEIGIEATHLLAAEARIGLTAADHCFSNLIGSRIPKGEKAEALVRKHKDWALKTASAAVPNSNGGGSSRGGGGSGNWGGSSRGGGSKGGGQRGSYDRDSDR
jgi:hypothetical protein